MIKAVIFDFDGLIIDTETLWFEVYRDVFREEGGDLPLEQWAKCIGTTFAAFDPFQYLSEQIGREVDRARIESMTSKRYHAHAAHLELRPGVRQYLAEARELGLRIGLASSSNRDWVEGYLRKFDLFDFFEAISTKYDVEKVKPAPDLYMRTMELLAVTPEEAIVFEDSLNGLNAALDAGITCVIVPNPATEHLAFAGERHRLSSMADIPLSELIDLINKKPLSP